MNEFTLLSFSNNTADNNKNKERLTQLNSVSEHPELKAPENAVSHVLNYSKALSLRKSSTMNFIKNILN